jgi:hypothetical protein
MSDKYALEGEMSSGLYSLLRMTFTDSGLAFLDPAGALIHCNWHTVYGFKPTFLPALLVP